MATFANLAQFVATITAILAKPSRSATGDGITKADLLELFTDMATYVSDTYAGAGSGVDPAALNALIETATKNKADLISGKVDPNQLAAIYFDNFSGAGTSQNPYSPLGGGGGGNAEAYLKGLAGYDAAIDQILYGGASGFAWGPIPSGGNLPQLGTTVLTRGTVGADSIALSWSAVTDATGYQVQRSTNSGFTGATTVYSGSALSFSDTGLSGSTLYYYRARATGAGFTAGAWATANGTTLANGNTTPAAPTAGVVNDTADTFNWTNSSSFSNLSDYEFTLNGGTSYAAVTVKPLAIGNVAKAAGQVGVRVKAATGRNVSATLFNATAFTLAAAAELGQPVHLFQYLAGIDSDGQGNLVRTDESSGTAALALSIQDSDNGFLSMRLPVFNLPGESSSNTLTLGVGLDPHYGGTDTIMWFLIQGSGQIAYRKGASSPVYGPSGTVQANGIVRMRFDATTVYLEYSNNEGVSWTQVTTAARSAGTLRSKIGSTGNQFRNRDLRSFIG